MPITINRITRRGGDNVLVVDVDYTIGQESKRHFRVAVPPGSASTLAELRDFVKAVVNADAAELAANRPPPVSGALKALEGQTFSEA